MNEALEPVVTLGYAQNEDGTFTARMTVSGLETEKMAQAAIAHMQALFCGKEQVTHD